MQSIKSSAEDIDVEASQETTQANNNPFLSSNIKEQFPIDDEIISKSKLSPIASQFPLIPSKGIL